MLSRRRCCLRKAITRLCKSSVPSLKIHNAYKSSDILKIYFLCANSEFFYVRNHLPVPEVDPATYELEINVDGEDRTLVLTYEQIMAMPKHHVTAAIMCGGNRRSEMNEVKTVKGLSWGAAAVGNAQWSGPKLCDILAHLNVKSDEVRHVHVSNLLCSNRYQNRIINSSYILVRRTRHRPNIECVRRLNTTVESGGSTRRRNSGIRNEWTAVDA